jgi:hypothetical protein
MAKYYLVVEEGWEYNDEYYYMGDSNSYRIESKLLKSKKEAQKIADEKNENSVDEERFTDSMGEPIRPYKVVEVED